MILFPVSLQATAEPLTTLETLVQQWVQLRATLAQEQRAWTDRKGQWQREIDLLKQEATSLQETIDEGSRYTSHVEQERAEVLARKDALQAELQQLKAVLDRAEAQLRAWDNWLPAGLRKKLAAGLRALPATQQEAEERPVSRRAQAVAALLTQLEQLHNGNHVTREMLPVGDGTRRQVDVLYLGLARAFAVTADNDWAAVGTPGAEGWHWQPQPQHARAIRDVLQVFNREQTARLVELPLAVSKEQRP